MQRPRIHPVEQPAGLVERAQHRLGHAVVQRGGHVARRAGQVIGLAALDAADGLQAAVARDVGRLGRPGRKRAQARHHEDQLALRRGREAAAVVQQPLEPRALRRARLARRLHEIAVLRRHRAQAGIEFLQGREQLREAELRQRARAAELEDVGH